ncbi:MAG: hypothetical protein ACM31C_15300 [Acidobacteriota bacterium]
MQVRPGLLYAYDAPRMIQELLGEVEFLEYILHSDRPSVTGHASWKAFLLPGPRSDMLLSADASRGQLNALSSRNTPDQTGIGVLPSGTAPIDVDSANASENLSWISSKATRTAENAFANWTATDDNQMNRTTTSVVETGLTVSFDSTFRSSSLGIQAGGSFLRLERIAPPGAMPGSTLQKQLNPRATAVFRYDIDKHWSVNLDGGAIYVNPIGSDKYNPGVALRAATFPIFGGLLAYTETWGRAALTARRSVTPDMFIAVDTVDDTLMTQVAMPLPWLDDHPHARSPKLVGMGTLAVEHAQLIDPDTSMLQGNFYLARADVGVAWTPHPGQTYGLRYQLIYQHGNGGTAILEPSFYTNTLFFTFSLRYPDRVAAQVPRRLDSVRADRKDLSPVGAEPVVPDPTEDLPLGDDSDGGDGRDR